MSDRRYSPAEIEPKWQELWAREHTWEVANDPDHAADHSYVLEMLPYPSGEPHVGHLKNYALGDAIAHYHRRTGHRVLHPMGYDAFGLPAENNAIKTGVHPRVATDRSIAAYRHWFHRWGISIDWSRELGTHEPSYYRWTQWIFLKLFERGLAYRKEAAVKWCPFDQTVLANEQVIDGRCERCGHEVELRQLEQWFFRITDYADRLLADLDTIDWPEHVKAMQRNWIGRSEGAEVTFHCDASDVDYTVFTTRPDTLFGATFFVMAPEHPDVLKLVAGTEHEAAVHEYVNRALTESAEVRGDADKPKTGVPLGQTVTNPVNGEQLPMFVADYVLMEYGTGAVMGVPAHDQRDYEFATAFDLPIRPVVAPADVEDPDISAQAFTAHTADERLINSGEFSGMDAVAGRDAIVARLAQRGQGPSVGQLSPARLAHLPPALLGLPDPDRLLRRLRDGPGPRVRPAGQAARRRGLPAARPLAAGRRRGLGDDHLPALRRPGAPRDRHDGHLRGLQLVLPALLRRPQRHGAVGPAGAGVLDAGGHVHRRGRARDPAPALQPLLRQGAGRHGSARRPGAVPDVVHAGDDPRRRRQQDVQLEGQRRGAQPDRGALRGRRRPLLRAVHGPARAGRGMVGHRRPGRAQVPHPPVAARRRPRRGGGPDGRDAGRSPPPPKAMR